MGIQTLALGTRVERFRIPTPNVSGNETTVQVGGRQETQVQWVINYNKPLISRTVSRGELNQLILLGADPGTNGMAVLLHSEDASRSQGRLSDATLQSLTPQGFIF